MRTEDFVTYEQALALKKLEFREECLYHYDRGTLKSNYFDDNVVFTDELYNSYNTDYQTIDTLCDAPTLWEVQKWLRKEKKLSIEPFSHAKTKWIMDITNLNTGDCPEMLDKYTSYEEALSAGITECIKLLEK